MDIAGRARKMAAGAVGVAVATGGLSSCGLGGVVDPAPPPLVCSDVSGGQVLVPSAVRTGNVVDVTIRPTNLQGLWDVGSVSGVTGATVSDIVTPRPLSRDSLTLKLTVSAAAPTVATFTLQGTITGLQSEQCSFTRTFTVTLPTSGVLIAELRLDTLPLPARERAAIVLASREGRVLELQAKTDYRGAQTVAWAVTGGTLENPTAPRTRWTLPAQSGLYQAEVVMDFGEDGMAFDAITVETTRLASVDEREMPGE